EENGVLLFRELHLDDDAQVAFCKKLGDLEQEMVEISRRPGNPLADMLRSNVQWHIDGTSRDPILGKATVLSAKVVAPEGGETEFASTYAAYDDLSDEEKERYAKLRVVHS